MVMMLFTAPNEANLIPPPRASPLKLALPLITRVIWTCGPHSFMLVVARSGAGIYPT
jgi:hypothetical protein